ncbi:glycosyltransferase family 1 protein, partial [bacterium]
MRILFYSRRYFPAISGMSVYAQNLLRELVKMGHEVTMISQYRGDEAGTRVYGGGPPPPLDGVSILGLEALGEQESPACWEKDIETMVQTGLAQHEKTPFDIVHAQYG